MARKTYAQLLDEIHDGALDSRTNLPDLLRKCIALGGEIGSERLRDWARQELLGYGPRTEVPEYRRTASLLYLDGATFGGLIRGQQVPLTMIPADIRDKVRESMNNIEIRQPVAELVDIVESRRRRGGGSVKLAPPLVQELVALINHELHAAERRNDPFPSPVQLPPSQTVERVYWEVGVNTFAAAIDAVRTALVQLVVEIRAVPGGAGAPSRDAAEQAVDVALYGKARVRNLVINQVAAACCFRGRTSAGAETSYSRFDEELISASCNRGRVGDGVCRNAQSVKDISRVFQRGRQLVGSRRYVYDFDVDVLLNGKLRATCRDHVAPGLTSITDRPTPCSNLLRKTLLVWNLERKGLRQL